MIWKRAQVDVEFSLCRPLVVGPTKNHQTKLTLNIVLDICRLGLVIMDHLNNLQKVILVQLLQAVGKLLHIELHHKSALRLPLSQ